MPFWDRGSAGLEPTPYVKLWVTGRRTIQRMETMAVTLRDVLREPTYRRLFLAQVTALAGTGVSTIAIALLAYELAGAEAGLVLGTALALKMVAYVGIAPVVGGFAHLIPRKPVLIGLDLVRAGLVGCLVFADQIWHLYLLIFLLNAANAGFTPLFQATIPDVLPDEARYTRALSLSRLAQDLEHLLSPVLAGAALLLVSFDVLFAVNTMTFLGSALLVASTVVPAARPAERGRGIWGNLSFGVAAYLKTPRLRGLLALYFAVTAGGAMVIVNTVVYVKDGFGLGDTAVTGALFAAGVGSIAVAIGVPRLLDRLDDRRVMLAGAALIVAVLALGLAQPGYAGLLGLWLLLGAGGSLIQTPAGRVLRRSCRDSDRSAFFAANFALQHAAWLVGYLAAGWLWSVLGGPGTFAALALLAAAGLIGAALLWPADDTPERTHHHAAVDHQHLHWHDEHHSHDHDGWEGPGPHTHPHRHAALHHRHPFVIDLHHPSWPG